VIVEDDMIGLAASWLLHMRRLSSENRADRLLAVSSGDVAGDVDEIIGRANDDSIALIDPLLRSPGADIGLVGAGPLEDLVSQSGEILGDQIAVLARRDPLGREAVGYVWLDDAEARRVPALALFLRKPPPRQ
jgi:hypothetical protein